MVGVPFDVVAVHRHQLPILSPCEDFVPPPGAVDEGGFCERCREDVHDVSTMRESELRRLLATREGTRVCLVYRTDAAGNIRTRPEPDPPRIGPGPLTLGALALLLVACAGHTSELEAPGEVCRDEDGYAVSCPTWIDPSMQSVPESSEPSEGCDPEEGCPVRPTAEEGTVDPAGRIDFESFAEGVSPFRGQASVVDLEPSPARSEEARVETQDTAAKARVNFSVDPDEEFVRGMIVVSRGGWIDRDFVPTTQLWKEWRRRRAEQRAARARWRASRGWG